MNRRLIIFLFAIMMSMVACGPASTEKLEAPNADQQVEAPSSFTSDKVDYEPLVSIQNEAESENESTAVVAQESDSEPVTGSYPDNTVPRPLTSLGDPNAPVVIVEYSDYQCPFCRRHFLQTMPLLKTEFIDTGRVYYVFKDFPIASLHPLAYRLHESALCAGEINGDSAYWQSHGLFFNEAETFQKNSEAAMDEAILARFDDLGFDVNEIEACLADGRYADEVQNYIREGQSLGVNGTPTFFINGNLLVGAQPFETFQLAINQVERGEAIAAAPTQPPPPPAVAPTPATIPARAITALGDPNAPVTIVEYSDYQCPFCRRHNQETMPLLITNYIDTGRVYYVFKDFPIASLHPLAYRLHEAALCVSDVTGTEGYWQAHDRFFADAEFFRVDSIAEMDAVILEVFAEMGLPDISACLENNTYADVVQAGVNEGAQLSVTGTPAFFINGYPVTGAQPYNVFEYAIGLAESGQLASAYEQAGPRDGKAQATATAQALLPKEIPLDDEPAKGDPNAPITIVEYSDYQCPFCLRHFEQTMPQLQAYIDAGQVRYVFKDFPLHAIHPQAQKAHEAARCARELGGDGMYWVMHDLLFANQARWAEPPVPEHIPVLKELAAEAGLPPAKFNTCLDSGKYYDAVNAEVDEGLQLGVRGTPAFFINGYLLSGAQPFSVFQQAVEQLQTQTD